MRDSLLIFFCFVSFAVFSQEDAWVFFTDKPDSDYFFSNPISELSQRSLDRRTIQNIVLDIKDAPLHQPYIDQVANSTGITILAKTKWLNALHVRGLQENIAMLSGLPFVDHIQYANHSLNPTLKTYNSTTAPTYVNKWLEFNNSQTNYNYGSSATQVQMLNCHILHQQNYTGQGKVVAILDAGFPGVNTAAPFASLRNRGLILGGYDFVNNSTNFYTGNSHGTNVLSTMGANATNLVGTAPDASYYLFITEDVASETPLELSNWVEAVEEADRLGADVVNSSLGYFGFDNSAYSYTYAEMNGKTSVASRAVDIAFSRGMICVISAGNAGGSSIEPHIGTPADALYAITVGAVTSDELKSGFSSIGPTGDGRMKPDLMAMGTASVISNTSGMITTASGTSFSSPILAGAITSFWSAFPNKKNSEIVQLVKASADRYSISTVTPNNSYGYGIPDFQIALSIVNQSQLQPEVEDFKIYPNPTIDYVTVLIPQSLIQSQLEIFNSMGQKIKSEIISAQKQNIYLSNLNKGVYLYKLSNSKSSFKGKLIKQ